MNKKLSKLISLLFVPLFLTSCSFDFGEEIEWGEPQNEEHNHETPTQEKPNHTHSFNQKTTIEKFIQSSATCTEPAKYYYSCECGERGTEVFTYGNKLGHDFREYVSNFDATVEHDGTKSRSCKRCGFVETVIDEGTATKDFLRDNGTIIGKGYYENHFEEIIFVNNSVAEGALSGLNCDILVVTESATKLGNQAFSGCSFKDAYFLLNNLIIGEDLFAGTWDDPNFKIHASKASASWYTSVSDVCWQNSVLNANKIVFEDNLPTFNKYKLTFHSNTDIEYEPVEQYLARRLPIPSKQNYIFMGWYDNASFNGFPITDDYILSRDLDLYAKWSTIGDIPVTTDLNIKDDKILGRGSCRDVTIKINKEVEFEAFNYDNLLINLILDYGTNAINEFSFVECKNLKNIYFVNDEVCIKSGTVFMGCDNAIINLYQSNFNKLIRSNCYLEKYIVENRCELIDAKVVGYNFYDGNNLLETFSTDDIIRNLPRPKKDEMSFVGWYLNKELSGDCYRDYFCFDKNINLYCKWFNAKGLGINQSEGLEIRDINGELMVTGLGSCTQKDIIIDMPITERAFENECSITSVKFGGYVTYIGDNAFGCCDNLKYAEFLSSVVPTTGNDLFSGTWDDARFRVYCPKGCYDLFKSIKDIYWYGAIVEAGKLVERDV